MELIPPKTHTSDSVTTLNVDSVVTKPLSQDVSKVPSDNAQESTEPKDVAGVVKLGCVNHPPIMCASVPSVPSLPVSPVFAFAIVYD